MWQNNDNAKHTCFDGYLNGLKTQRKGIWIEQTVSLELMRKFKFISSFRKLSAGTWNVAKSLAINLQYESIPLRMLTDASQKIFISPLVRKLVCSSSVLLYRIVKIAIYGNGTENSDCIYLSKLTFHCWHCPYFKSINRLGCVKMETSSITRFTNPISNSFEFVDEETKLNQC